MANRSLVFRLAVNIVLALLSTMALLSVFVVFRATIVSNGINEKSLETRLDQIIHAIYADKSGKLHFILPENLQHTFSPLSHDDIYIVKSKSDNAIWVSHSELKEIAQNWNVDKDDGIFISINDVFPDRGNYYGIEREFKSPLGKFVAVVAQSGDQRAFAKYILSEFIEDIAWASPVFILLMVTTVVATIRSNLRVLSVTSARASMIDPAATNIRLATEDLPREIVPLVTAINGALDRLEARFSFERRFTADAAHELRTPLSILKARIDKLSNRPAREDLDMLKRDVDRMARVVSQLLAVARLEMPQTARQMFVLNDLIKDVVGELAPLAISKHQDLAVTLPRRKVSISADYAELVEAVRNLVENAIAHCPPGTEIEIRLGNGGDIRIVDNGPGIPDSDKERIFERFFRGGWTGSPGTGAGLGLCIARGIADRLGGKLAVEDTPNGGATFVLSLPLEPA